MGNKTTRKKEQRFIPGLVLNKHFYHEVVRPLIDIFSPGLEYSAGLLGNGSDVLGYDSIISTDHNWGPRLVLFLPEQDFEKRKNAIWEMLSHKLPYEFMGYSTHYTQPQQGYLVQQMIPATPGKPVNHMVEIYTVRGFFLHFLGFDPFREVIVKDWLKFPQQSLLEVTSGEVYHDGLEGGLLSRMRHKFHYYPFDVWMYIYLMQWDKIVEQQAFIGRTGEVGDELGSQIISNRFVNNVMRWLFIAEQKYIPYPKWFGRAFTDLIHAREFIPLFSKIFYARTWKKRESYILDVYMVMARIHNSLKITKPIKPIIKQFHDRPFKIFDGRKFIEEIDQNLDNMKLKNLKYKIGSVDQFLDLPRLSHLDYLYLEFEDVLNKTRKEKVPKFG